MFDLGTHDAIAKKVAKDLDKESTYTITDIGNAIVKAGNARMSTDITKKVGEKLKEMGFQINESRLMGFDDFLFEKNND